MCRSIHCMMAMSGHGRRINMEELTALLQQHLGGHQEPEQTHEEFLANAIESVNTSIRANEIALSILQATPREGAKLAGLEIVRPRDPKKHGVLAVVTYALEGGSFLVVGTDYLTQYETQHTTPNEHGLDGLQHATLQELAKRSVEGAEEEAAAQPEAQPS